MKKRWLGTIAALAIASLAASAMPAFTQTSPTGTVEVTITAQAPAAPCLTVTPNSVDFGTLPFSSNSAISVGNTNITTKFCGTAAGQTLLGSTTPAAGTSGSWTPLSYYPSQSVEPCPAPDRFYLFLFGFTTFVLYMTEDPAPVLQSSGGPPAVFPLGDKVFQFGINMPCQGSNGPGEPKSITATFTAVIP